jgi:hypothetical protein
MATTKAYPETSSSGRFSGSMRPAQMPLPIHPQCLQAYAPCPSTPTWFYCSREKPIKIHRKYAIVTKSLPMNRYVKALDRLLDLDRRRRPIALGPAILVQP